MLLAIAFVAPAFLPGRVMVPMDLPEDLLAWKGDASVRVRVSNSLLSDVPLQLVPWDIESRRLLAAGEIPWRNRFAGDGADLFASPLAALLSPFTWPRLASVYGGWEWSVLLKLCTAALGMFWLARVMGGSLLAAFLSAAVFIFSGYSIVWALYPHTNVFVLLPALAAAAVAFSREVTPGRALALAALAALATAGGHPETLFIGVLAIAAWLPFASAPRKVPVAIGALGGFLLIGIQLVPFALILSKSYVIIARAEQLGSAFRKFSILSLVLPGYLGSPLQGELDLTGLFAGTENFNQRSGAFVGALSLLAIVIAWRHLSRALKAGLSIAIVSFLLSLSLPLVGRLLHSVPLFGWTAPEYYAVGFVLFASLAAGPALEALLAGGRRKLGIVLVAIGLTAALGGATPALMPGALERAARTTVTTLKARGHLAQPAEVYEARLRWYLDAARGTALRRVTLPGLCWAAFGAALLIPPGRRRAAIGSAAVLAELVVFSWGYNPVIRTSEIASEPEMLRQVRSLDPEKRWSIASSHEVFPPNLSTIWGVHDVHSYDILTSRDRAEELAPAGYDPLRWTLPVVPTPEQLEAMGRLGVRFYLLPDRLLEIPDAVERVPVENTPPRGLAAGGVVSLIGATIIAVLAAWCARRKRRAGTA